MAATPEVAKHFGANLKRARRRADLSQEELARLASLHRTEISKLERGERAPRIDTVAKLGCSLDVDLGPLFAGVTWHVGGGAQAGGFEVGDPGI